MRAELLKTCHPERVIKLSYLIVLIVDNMAICGCVGTVQPNCVNFGQFRCYKSFFPKSFPEFRTVSCAQIVIVLMGVLALVISG